MAFVALTVGISSLLIALAYDHIQGGWPSL
jgi:hypothetical protein